MSEHPLMEGDVRPEASPNSSGHPQLQQSIQIAYQPISEECRLHQFGVFG